MALRTMKIADAPKVCGRYHLRGMDDKSPEMTGLRHSHLWNQGRALQVFFLILQLLLELMQLLLEFSPCAA